jgi:hypothetical protein
MCPFKETSIDGSDSEEMKLCESGISSESLSAVEMSLETLPRGERSAELLSRVDVPLLEVAPEWLEVVVEWLRVKEAASEADDFSSSSIKESSVPLEP